jgi:hypothetical protein
MNTNHPEFSSVTNEFVDACSVTNEFIDEVESITEESGYILHNERSQIWMLIDTYIANELPFVLASRPVSQVTKETLNHELRLFWIDEFENDYILFDEVDKIIRIKIDIQLCCKCFLARKRLAELKRNFAIATAFHPRLGEKSILATLTEDLLLACLI